MTRWVKSSRSGGGPGDACVEVGQAPGAVLVRDSKDPDGPRLTFGTNSWRDFVAAVKAGELDLV